MWEQDGSKSEENYRRDGKRHGPWKAWKDGKLTEDSAIRMEAGLIMNKYFTTLQ